MSTTARSLTDLTAGDLMNRDLVTVSQETPLREAGRLLLLHQISGLPVVEPGGACVGVLSTTDILRWAFQQNGASDPRTGPRPYSCTFQLRDRGINGSERVVCTLPLDACPLQRKEGEKIICSQPHEVLADWQVVEVEQLPTETVGQFMTSDPVTVAVDTLLPELARRMIDAHVHRVIVVDRLYHPVGIVSSTDILAGVARAGRAEREE
ncbi:MAG TPA: CBS domain-containing protein [Gemmataceae bacterium]|jgi:CBS domain-containing protein